MIKRQADVCGELADPIEQIATQAERHLDLHCRSNAYDSDRDEPAVEVGKIGRCERQSESKDGAEAKKWVRNLRQETRNTRFA